jgi:hypothetical protein
MSLIAFHRFLIAAGILFCIGFAGWETTLWWVTRARASLVLALVFLVLGGLLGFYLSRLNRFLGLGDRRGPGPR